MGNCTSRDRPDWVIEIEQQVGNNEILTARETGAWRNHTIYKIPEGFVSDDKRKQAYQPQVVSMGPYHHGEKQLQPMEEHKLRALRHFLVRTNRGVSEYREALSGVVQELIASYRDLGNEWKNDEERFLQLMIFDGCFMIEVLEANSQMVVALRNGQRLNLIGYGRNDPIFSGQGMLSIIPRIRRDMLMIENQIPLLVLKRLLSVAQGVVDGQDENRAVNNMVLAFFVTEQEYMAGNPVELGLHALDVVRKSMIRDINVPGCQRTPATNDVIWPATHLQEAGIKFMKSRTPSLKDIHFNLRYRLYPTLSLPQLVVDDTTESKFLNIMAFEQLHVSLGNEVSSYVCFMDNIIDSEKDVSVLSQNDIIKNFVGTDQAVADLFNGISHDVSIDPASNLRRVHQDVTEYCKKPFNKHWAKLMHSHFNTPWSIIAFLAASVAILITITQFVYSTIDLKNKKTLTVSLSSPFPPPQV